MGQGVAILAGFPVCPKPGCSTRICHGTDSSALCTQRRPRRCVSERRESIGMGRIPQIGEWRTGDIGARSGRTLLPEDPGLVVARRMRRRGGQSDYRREEWRWQDPEWGVMVCLWSREEGFYSCCRASSVVLFDQLGSVHLGCGFPRIVALGVPFPFKEILQFLLFPKIAMAPYCFHLVFVFSYCNVGRRSGEVRTIVICFDVWG
jgi:hypothetical protein